MTGAASASPDPGGHGFAIAFEPIVRIESGIVHAYKAILCCRDGGDVGALLNRMDGVTLRKFDARCRAAALRWAAKAGLAETDARLIVPLLTASTPDARGDARQFHEVAQGLGIAANRIIVQIPNPHNLLPQRLKEVMWAYSRPGCRIAYGGFGGTDAEIANVTRQPPNWIELDSKMVHGLCESWARRILLDRVIEQLTALAVGIIASGVVDQDEAARIHGFGGRFISGPCVAMPQIGELPASRFGGLAPASPPAPARSQNTPPQMPMA